MDTTCPRCDGTMEEGFIPDSTHAAIRVSGWYRGKPERSFWLGLRVRMRDAVPLVAMRCRECGFVELYAPPTVATEGS
jgi:hypothetical protein